ncbi:MAG: glycosyltransferase family 2 protein [Bacteroidetes bacterium]|nr:glycosyltransferase family 2 protein [Bacteroidota bacterium]
MTISGFTFVRNAIKFDYPIVEALLSVIPLCDEFIVAVGNSEDGTRELVQSIGDSRIKILDTIWDDSLREGGHVLALETDKAFDAVSPESTWAFYIQADEILHEKYIGQVRKAMQTHAGDLRVEGLVFDYLHFYGSYNYIGDSRDWYRREVRIIRNDKSIRSYLDAQGFRKNGRKLTVAPSNATIYHYGWVKPPEKQQSKQQNFHRYWHSDKWMAKEVPKTAEFDYSISNSLAHFTGTHPVVMEERIIRKNWKFERDPTKNKLSPINRLLRFIEKLTGWRAGEYKNYRIPRR